MQLNIKALQRWNC